VLLVVVLLVLLLLLLLLLVLLVVVVVMLLLLLHHLGQTRNYCLCFHLYLCHRQPICDLPHTRLRFYNFDGPPLL
jgi:hypothetical protein